MLMLPQQLMSLKEAAALLFTLLNHAKSSALFASLHSAYEHILLYSQSDQLASACPDGELPGLSLSLDSKLHAYPSSYTLYYTAADSASEIQLLLKKLQRDAIALTICRLPIHQSSVIIGSSYDGAAENQSEIDQRQSLSIAAQLISHLVLLEHASITDDLTELYNKRFLTYLKATATKQEGSIVFIDFNSFKQINDTYGHAAGDAVLKESAARLKAQLRKTDQLIRYGGDEFIIYIQEKLHESDLEALTIKLQAALSEPIPYGENITIDVTASFGFSIGDSVTESIDQLIKQADKDMYEEKHKKGM
ncbi:GGDEF domain-containing protein [Paenibacillus sp. GXUN7292]|uniref:GGDEF domain-containing protein n=1 Tax=Paenibacillus sp. GXUN7292 TaxID=3422499 RepID=UPI003D7F0217